MESLSKSLLKDTRMALQMGAFRRAVSNGARPKELLHTLLLETIAAMDASGGALYMFERNRLEVFGRVDDELNAETFQRCIADFRGQEYESELLIDEPDCIAAPIWLYGRVAGAICTVERQCDDEIGEFRDYEKALLVALAATASVVLEKHSLQKENKKLKAKLSKVADIPFILGESASINEVKNQIERITSQDLKISVLIQGESGSGKELVARAIHYKNRRKDKSFVVLNCAAIPETLLESELFGYEKGAFTGAFRSTPGKIEVADKGILFLDEICEMSPALQAKLLRVLESGEFQRLGSTKMRYADFQLISATNSDLAARVADGAFRQDLYYRIKAIQINVPPLRKRFEDIPSLVRHFLKELNANSNKLTAVDIAPPAMSVLASYKWPGNIRELKHVIEQAFVLCENNTIEIAHIPHEITGLRQNGPLIFTEIMPLEDAIQHYVKYAFLVNRGKTNRTMQDLQIDHRRLRRYLDQVNVSLVLPHKKNAELKAVRKAGQIMTKADFDEDLQISVKRALMEAIINAVQHSRAPDKNVRVDLRLDEEQLKIVVSDSGIGFDPDKIKPVDAQAKVRRQDTKGWGLHIIRQAADHMQIKSGINGTSVTMCFNRQSN